MIQTSKKRSYYQRKYNQKRKCFIDNLKINGCAICGYDKCTECLDFHHVNPEDKKFGIGHDSGRYSIEKTLNEINKCILLCKNCHGEIHYKEKNKE